MTEFNEMLAQRVAARLRQKAADLRTDAGYSGSWSDNGAAALEEKVDAFLAGLNHAWPPGWEQVATELVQEVDPEWKEYQRLKAKFKDK